MSKISKLNLLYQRRPFSLRDYNGEATQGTDSRGDGQEAGRKLQVSKMPKFSIYYTCELMKV